MINGMVIHEITWVTYGKKNMVVKVWGITIFLVIVFSGKNYGIQKSGLTWHANHTMHHKLPNKKNNLC